MEPNLPAMSATPSNEGNPYIHRISDGIPASCPSVKFLKSAFDEVDQHCSLDILPILFDKAQVSSKLKYPFHRSHGVAETDKPKSRWELMQILFDHGTSKGGEDANAMPHLIQEKSFSYSQSWESRKRKRNASCCTCRPRRPAKTRKLALPEGFGYVPSASYVDENGVYQPVFTHQVAYMRCLRCGINGDHWEPFCLNPVNDPPETIEEAAKKKISWKYILRNFNPKEYIDKTQGKLQPSSRKAGISKSPVSRKCIHCRNQTPAKTEKPPLPEGFGYVPSASYVDEDGVYQPVFTHQVAYMRCHRCGINGDHWEPFCLNPINDPPETEEEAAKKKISWKYLLRNFNPKEYLEKHKTLEPEYDPPRLPELKFIGPKSRRAVFRLLFG